LFTDEHISERIGFAKSPRAKLAYLMRCKYCGDYGIRDVSLNEYDEARKFLKSLKEEK
jgi:hypothetical protein